jgi:tetratricopeptide (TPR) repeat protein
MIAVAVRVLLIAAFCACLLAQSPLEDALRLAREGRYAEARTALAKAPVPSGKGAQIAFHRLSAAIASGLGEGPRAAEEMRAALALAPADPNLMLAAAAAELQARELDAALKHARSAPDTAVARALIGDIREARGEYLEALEAYRGAAALDPQREQYAIAVALELVQHYTFPPAIEVLQEAAVRFPKSARIRTLLGIAQFAMGDAENAENSLADAIELDRGLDPAYTYLARFALETSRAPLERTLRVLCERPGAVCDALKLRVARQNGDGALLGAALAGLKSAPGDSAVARCELARAYEWSGKWTEARPEMEACVALDPSPQNHYRLGRIYMRLGMAERASREMESRSEAEQRISEEVDRRKAAVQAFLVVSK